MKLGLKLLIAFLLIASSVWIVNYFTSSIYSDLMSDTKKICQNSLFEILGAAEMSLAIHAGQIAAHDLITDQYHHRAHPSDASEAARGQAASREMVKSSLEAFERWLSLSKHASTPKISLVEKEDGATIEETVRRLDMLAQEYAHHAGAMDRFLGLIIDNGLDEANRALKSDVKAHFKDRLLPLIRLHQDETEAELVNELAAAEFALSRANRINFTIAVIAAVLAIVLGLVIARSIANPLSALKEAALRIGHGELNTKIHISASDEIGSLAKSFNKMASALKNTTVSKSYLDNIIRSMSEMLIVVDSQYRIETVNPAALKELDYSEEELLGKPLRMLFPTRNASDGGSESKLATLIRAGERVLLTRTGTEIPVFWSGSELRDEDNVCQGLLYVAKNITEQKRIEAQLRNSLNEKQVLLKEIHHRVKNNLQIISSLISLQSRRAREPEAESMFRDSENRIRSMALIHEQLYQSEDLAQIDFAEYVRNLVRQLRRSYGEYTSNIGLHVDVDPVQLSVDVAIPCGLLINELVSNAIEHAFPSGSGGEVWIGFKTDGGHCMLSVRDNGRGLPSAEKLDRTKTLGLELVRALVKQLRADMKIADQTGAKFNISFEQKTGKRLTDVC